jgi:hypothetical protein
LNVITDGLPEQAAGKHRALARWGGKLNTASLDPAAARQAVPIVTRIPLPRRQPWAHTDG